MLMLTETCVGPVPPYVAAVVLTSKSSANTSIRRFVEYLNIAVVVAYYSDHFKIRGPVILLFLPMTIAGYVLAIAATTNTARYAAVFLIAAGL
jgi:hypothetical protein